MKVFLKKKKYQFVVSVILVCAVVFTSINAFADSGLAAVLSGNAVISGDAEISGNAQVSGDAEMSGDAEEGLCRSTGTSYTSSKLRMKDIVLETLDDAKKDALSRPSGAKGAFVADASQSKWVLGTHNFSQRWFNEKYYSKNKVKIDGSCSEVATTILAEYYNRKERCVICNDRKGYQATWFPQFDKFITIASCLGIYKFSGGTVSARLHIIFQPFYSMYKKSMIGKKYTSALSDNIERLHKKAVPVIGSFVAPNGDGHSMVVAGYYDITVVYRTGNKTDYKSTTYRYYTVNNGWDSSCKGDKRIQYVRRSYLKEEIIQLEKN